MPQFEIHFDNETQASVDLNPGLAEVRYGPIVCVHESTLVHFYVHDPEQDTGYSITIGDESAEKMWENANRETVKKGKSMPERYPSRLGSGFHWYSHTYFESCVDHIFVHLLSHDRAGNLTSRILLTVFVTPEKMTLQQYDRMRNELSHLCGSLIFEFCGRNARTADLEGVPLTAAPVSRLGQWQRLQDFWRRLTRSEFLTQMGEDPVLTVRRTRRRMTCQNAGRLDSRAIADLLRQGFDPRLPHNRVRVSLPRNELVTDTVEHRMVVWVLRMLASRAAEFRTAADREHAEWSKPLKHLRATRLEKEQLRRDQNARRVAEIRRQADAIILEIAMALSAPLLAGLPAATCLGPTPVFRNVPAYAGFYSLLLRYLGPTYWSLDMARLDAVKKTSTLYEYWVYLQLVAACREAGMTATTRNGFDRLESQGRFVADLNSGTSFDFEHPCGTRIRMRFDAQVAGIQAAVDKGDLVFSYWGNITPDVLMEFQRRTGAGNYEAVHVVVMDAKYQPLDDETGRELAGSLLKYHQIGRATTRQKISIAPQLWLISPAFDRLDQMPSGVQYHDGFVALRPDESGARPPAGDWLPPAPQALAFIRRILESLEGTYVLPTG